ncbi:hypothetical protein CN918_29580 [Priestia megaterium]|nr:hypothetical protein CN918_29580 [Priestia megaterium]
MTNKTVATDAGIPLTKELIHLINYLQKWKDAFIAEEQFVDPHNHPKVENYVERTREVFYNVDDKKIKKLQLVKNDETLKKLLWFEITEEMKRTKYTELEKKFTF